MADELEMTLGTGLSCVRSFVYFSVDGLIKLTHNGRRRKLLIVLVSCCSHSLFIVDCALFVD